MLCPNIGWTTISGEELGTTDGFGSSSRREPCSESSFKVRPRSAASFDPGATLAPGESGGRLAPMPRSGCDPLSAQGSTLAMGAALEFGAEDCVPVPGAFDCRAGGARLAGHAPAAPLVSEMLTSADS